MSTPSRIRIRRRPSGTSDPTSDNLLHNEMGYAEATDILWYRDSDGNYRKVAGQGMGDDRYLRISQNLAEIDVAGSAARSTARGHLGLGSAAVLDAGTSEGDLAVLGAGGKFSENVLPSIAVANIDVVADRDARDALTPGNGDVAIVIDASADPDVDSGSASYIYDGSNWQKLRRPDDAVVSVFGRTGAVTAQANDYTWAQIDKSTSSLADIDVRSHGDLTDIDGDGPYHLSNLAASAVEFNYSFWITAVADDTSPTLSGNLNASQNSITNLPAPTADNDAARKVYVDNAIGDINHNDLNNIDGAGNYHITQAAAAAVESNYDAWILSLSQDANPTLSGNLNASGNRIVNLPAPTADNDAARKIYVDNAIGDINHNDLNNIDGDGTHHLTSAAASSVESNHNDWITSLLTEDLDAGGNRITNLATPQAGSDAVPFSHLTGPFVDFLRDDALEHLLPWREQDQGTVRVRRKVNWVRSSVFGPNQSIAGWDFSVAGSDPNFTSVGDYYELEIFFGTTVTQQMSVVPSGRYLMAVQVNAGDLSNWSSTIDWDRLAGENTPAQHEWQWQAVEYTGSSDTAPLSFTTTSTATVSRPYFAPLPVDLDIQSNAAVQAFLLNNYIHTANDQSNRGRVSIGTSEYTTDTPDMLRVVGASRLEGPVNMHGHNLQGAVIDCGTF